MPLLHGQSDEDEVDWGTNAKHRNESPLLRYAHPDEQVEEQQLKREIDSVTTHEANTILFRWPYMEGEQRGHQIIHGQTDGIAHWLRNIMSHVSY